MHAAGGASSLDEMFARMADGGGTHARGQSHDGGRHAVDGQDSERGGMLGRIDDDLDAKPAWKRSWK